MITFNLLVIQNVILMLLLAVPFDYTREFPTCDFMWGRTGAEHADVGKVVWIKRLVWRNQQGEN